MEERLMPDQGADEDALAARRRNRLGRTCEVLATLFEVTALVAALVDSNGLATAAARLVASGLRCIARRACRSR